MMMHLFSRTLWNNLSEETHKINSRVFSRFFISKLSRLFIQPYCFFYGITQDYLEHFYPESESLKYKNFGDFFKRKLKFLPPRNSPYIWPCEGYLCDWGSFEEKLITDVKGQKISPQAIFQSDRPIAESYFFTNIFLHNHNYHRVHAPVSGKITDIKRINGALTFLRPWFYQKDSRSLPALKNERVNVEIVDNENRTWYLSMVGGFGVGTIKLADHVGLNSIVKLGDELGWFELGSTVCMASPITIQVEKYLQPIQAGADIRISFNDRQYPDQPSLKM